MTHLSDVSFVHRALTFTWFYLWFYVYVWTWDRFEALQFRRIMRFELRSIVTLLLVISIPTQLFYDIGSAWIKYNEGFMVIPQLNNIIMGKPAVFWSTEHKDLAIILDYVLATGLALQTSIFFLLLAFWNFISKSVTKSSFMSSLEFKLNIAMSCGVIIMFPLIQYLFRNNTAFREAAPQLAFSIVLLMIAVLGIRTHFRFKSLIRIAMKTVNESTMGIVEKLEYFKDCNLILTVSFFLTGVPLAIASIDGLTAQKIGTNKFASDVLIENLNIFDGIIFVTVVMIFYPRRSGNKSAFGSSGGTQSGPTQNGNNNNNGSLSMHARGGQSNGYNGNKISNNNSHHHPDMEYGAPVARTGSTNRHHQDAHLSHIPYRNPDAIPEGQQATYYGNDHSIQNKSAYPYTDKHPLTKAASGDSYETKVNVYNNSNNYDDPLRQQTYNSNNNGGGGGAPLSPRQQIRFDQSVNSHQGSSRSNNSVPRSPIQAPVSNQSFVLDEAPGMGKNRLKQQLEQQQQQQYQPHSSAQLPQYSSSEVFYDDFGEPQRPSTPTRPRKEPRAVPRN